MKKGGEGDKGRKRGKRRRKKGKRYTEWMEGRKRMMIGGREEE